MKYKGLYYLFQILVVLIILGLCTPLLAAPIEVTGDDGNRVCLESVPERVVSLVPSATEIIFAIGAGELLAGITYHSSSIPGAGEKTVVGGFFSPSPERIMALKPDLVVVSSMHSTIVEHLDSTIPVLVMNTRQMKDAFRHIQLMGTICDRKEAASELVEKNRRQLDLIAMKVAKIGEQKRKRVMRFMGQDQVMTPGNDSFQNEIIRAAGGIPPDFGKAGSAVPVDQEAFFHFNPQVIYGCRDDRMAAESFFTPERWGKVDAVEQNRVCFFPCDLTCRASSRVGNFVSWLASIIYAEEFSDAQQEVLPRKVTGSRSVKVQLDFVRQAGIVTSIIHDFENKSLVVDFKSPRTVVSTLEGQRDGILTVGNHFSPPPCWSLKHGGSIKELQDTLFPVIGKDERSSSFLFTGADMDNLAIKTESFKDMTVLAMVTAGVQGNAVRMGVDKGGYYEPGTINMILFTNMKLSPRAMTRAIISATEAKTAALEDLDIRSSYLPLAAAATGTGTDNIIVVQGDGPFIDNAGGHCKMGELIARAAYNAIREAIFRQNGIAERRNIFQRLADRHLNIFQLVSDSGCHCHQEMNVFLAHVEQVLLNPKYEGFLKAALAMSDGAGRGTINDFSLFESWCLDVAGQIAGTEVEALTCHFSENDMPQPLADALGAVFTGVSLFLQNH